MNVVLTDRLPNYILNKIVVFNKLNKVVKIKELKYKYQNMRTVPTNYQTFNVSVLIIQYKYIIEVIRFIIRLDALYI